MINNELFNYFLERYHIALSEKEIQEVIDLASEKSSFGKKNNEIAREVFDFYNSNRNNMPEAEVFSDTRRNNIKTRIKQYGLEKVKEVISLSSKSDFLNGKTNNWTASFDWIIKPANFIKILEGNYNNKSFSNTKINSTGNGLRQSIER